MTGLFSPAYGDTIREVVQKPAVERFLNKKYNRILDLGCGTGFYTWLVKADQKIALDYSLGNAKSAGGLPKTLAVNGDAQALPLKNDSFGAVLCLEVLEHLKEDGKALKEIKRVLKKNGDLILSVPLKPAPIVDTAHVREGYSPEEIRKMLAETGFVLEKEKYCMHLFSRLAFKLLNFSTKKLGVRPPAKLIKGIASLDFLFRTGKPYDIIVMARKQ